MRAVYNCGESSDSNPVIASLDAQTDRERGGAYEVVGEADRDNGQVQDILDGDNQGSGINEVQIEAVLHGTAEIDGAILDSNNNSEGGVWGATEQAAGNGGGCAVGETEAPGFLPSHGCYDNSEQQTYPLLSHSTSSYQQTNTIAGEIDAQSALKGGSDLGSLSPQVAMSQLTHCTPETDHVQADIDKDNKGEDQAEMPPDFDGSHLFRLVPRAHHITDETVSVMSNCTEEYVGGSSSRDTVSHERSLTSMIFDACELGDSTSDSSSSDSGRSELGDTESSVDHNNEIQQSYLAQLPQQGGHTIPSQKTEEGKKEYQETEEVEKLCCVPATEIPKQSHDSVTSGGIRSEVSTRNNSIGMCDSALSVPSHPPPTYGPSLPHPLPFLFDGAAGTSSKHMPRLLHPPSDVQLHGGVQELAVGATTLLTLEPDSLTTVLGSAPRMEVCASEAPARSKAEAHLKETPSEKVSAVATGNVTSSQSGGTVEEDNKWGPLSCPSLPSEANKVNGEHPITSTSGSLGSQTLSGAFHNVARTTYLNLQPLLSCKQRETLRELVNTSGGIPEVAGDAAAGHERNVEGKPFSNSDSPCKREDSEERGVGGVEMNNKSNFELPIGKGNVTVELQGQLAKGFDQLQAFERLPNAIEDSNLSSGLKETKTSTSMACSETGVPLSDSEQQLANRLPTLVYEEQQNYSAAATDVGTVTINTNTAESPGSSTSPSSAQLASLLLSQLETDLNTM